MSGTGQRTLVTASALMGLSGLPLDTASAREAAFRITTTWIVNYTEPRPKSVLTRRTYFVTLKADGSIEEKVESRIGNSWVGPSLTSRDTALGELGGRRGGTVWKVVNETTLVRLVARASHTFVIWLRTEGDRACTATLEWRLKPGFGSYEVRNRSDKVTSRFSEPSWPNARCDLL